MTRATTVTAIVAVLAAATASSSASEPLAPQVIELEAVGNADTPRIAVSISSARAHPSGYLQSTIRLVSGPAGRWYFVPQGGIRLGTPGRSAGLIGLGRLFQGTPIVWVYADTTLIRMRARGAYISAWLRLASPGSPCCPPQNVRGRIDVERLARPVRTVASAAERAVLHARLTPDELTHEPRGVPTRARGTFRASVWPYRKTRTMLTFDLSTRSLTGPPVTAHVHAGAPGRNGPVLMRLCERSRCNLSRTSYTGLPADLVRTMRTLGAYVDVHTKRNRRGELRGQIVIEAG